METDDDLLARYARIRKDRLQAMQAMDRMKLGSAARDRKARWVGSLCFLLLGMESEMERRGLARPQ